MEKNLFPTITELQKVIDKNGGLLKLMYEANASTHAMALTMYASVGGYDSILRRLRSDIQNAKTVPERYSSERDLVLQAQNLQEKSIAMIRTLQNDNVLTPFMVKKIAYRYMENPQFIETVKRYMHREVRNMIRSTVRDW